MTLKRAIPALSALALLIALVATAHANLYPVTGACGELDAELVDASPHVLATDVGVVQCDFVSEGLSPGGLEILLDGNAGGSSIYSEILAHELALQCEQAVLLKTENEIVYTDPNGKKTDLLVTIDGVKIGVSVTRAIVYPPGTPLSAAQAQSLLEGKLGDILISSANVDPVDAWQKQILVVETPSSSDRDVVLGVLPSIDETLRADTVVWVVQTDGEDDFLYFGPEPVCDPTNAPGLAGNSLSVWTYPNPFNPRTTISFTTLGDRPVSVGIFDSAGRKVRTLAESTHVDAGKQQVVWDGRADDGRSVGSGVYMVRVASGGVVATHRAVLLK